MEIISIESNPYHALAQFLRFHFLPNPLAYRFKYAVPGDMGIVIGSFPNNLFLFIDPVNIRLFHMSNTSFDKNEWSGIYGQTFLVVSSPTSHIGFHALISLKEILKAKQKADNIR